MLFLLRMPKDDVHLKHLHRFDLKWIRISSMIRQIHMIRLKRIVCTEKCTKVENEPPYTYIYASNGMSIESTICKCQCNVTPLHTLDLLKFIRFSSAQFRSIQLVFFLLLLLKATAKRLKISFTNQPHSNLTQILPICCQRTEKKKNRELCRAFYAIKPHITTPA